MSKSNVQNADGFVLVKSSKKKRRSNKTDTNSACLKSTHQIYQTPETKDVFDTCAFLRKYTETENDLISSTFFSEIANTIIPTLQFARINHIICLGLGKLSECTISRYQLAFIRAVRDKLGIDNKIQYFDPIFDANEKQLLGQLEGLVLHDNLEGKYIANNSTLFYLPHCPKEITNNLLWRNWNLSLLKNLYLISNSFDSIVNNSPNRLLQQNANFVLNIIDCCREINLTNSFRYKDIFNDLSLHYFDIPRLETKPAEFWKVVEPLYTTEDIELISHKISLI